MSSKWAHKLGVVLRASRTHREDAGGVFAVASLFPVINCSSLCASVLSAASPLFAVDTEGPLQTGALSAHCLQSRFFG